MINKTTTKINIDITNICVWFLSSLFIWLGWKVLVAHFGLPYFTYLEIFAMRMGLSGVMSIFRKATVTQDKA
jgi:hypothetical protein